MNLKNIAYTLIACSLLLVSCGKEDKKVETTASGLNPARFASTVDSGESIKMYALKNDKGMEVCLTNLGMRIISVMVPDKDGNFQDVALGFDNIAPYKEMNNFMGSVLGRYAGRIANGAFVVSRAGFSNLTKNDGNNTLNSGPTGFHSRAFRIEQSDENTITGIYVAKNKEGGFPGDMELKVTYTLTNDNALDIQYEAFSNMSTIINITNQCYFNLSGNPANGIANHILYVNADNYTPTDEHLIPTGKIESVKDTNFDFTTPKPIHGDYDVNLVLINYDSETNLAARVECLQSGIMMEVLTTEPGLGLSTGNELNNLQGKNEVVYNKQSGFSLTTQHFPNSANVEGFPSTALYPGDVFQSHTIYKFSVKK